MPTLRNVAVFGTEAGQVDLLEGDATVRKHIYDSTGKHLLRTEQAEPKCGEDFCDTCGDCLHCYGSETCFDGDGPTGGPHLWVVYEEPQCRTTGGGRDEG